MGCIGAQDSQKADKQLEQFLEAGTAGTALFFAFTKSEGSQVSPEPLVWRFGCFLSELTEEQPDNYVAASVVNRAYTALSPLSIRSKRVLGFWQR